MIAPTQLGKSYSSLDLALKPLPDLDLALTASSLLAAALHGFFRDQDHMGHVDELAAFFAGQFLQAPERFLFTQRAAFHQDSLGPFDDLAILEGLAQVGRLLAELF